MNSVFRHFLCGSPMMLALVLLMTVSGCGRNDDLPETASTEGTVSWQGQPVAGATVAFSPESGGKIASAKTDEDGHYELTTFEPYDGAIVGQHAVTIVKRVPMPPPHISVPDAGKPLIPSKYFAAQTSGLTADVKAGESNVYDFTLEGEVE